MFGGLDAFVALAGLIIPPAVDFVRKKFLKKGQDTPEATMSTLATTRPDVLPEYVKAQAGYMDATVKYFNRDVCGIPAQWVVNCRAIIRPLGVTLAAVTLGIMVVAALQGHKPDPSMIDTLAGIRLSSEAILSSWFGDRISISK
jgi:hypothetical protein